MSTLSQKYLNNYNNNNNNNNNNVTSTKSFVKVQYKPIDEMNENSILKEKEIKVSDESKDIYLNILWMNKNKKFIHLSQAIESAQLNYDFLSKFIIQSFKSPIKNEIIITKFLKKSNNKEVYEWVHNSIGLNLENEKEINFIV